MSVKKKFSHLGLSIVFYLLISNLLGVIAVSIASAIYSFLYAFNMMASGELSSPSIDPRLAAEIAIRFTTEHSGLINLLAMVPSYFIALPLALLFLNSSKFRDIPSIGGFKFSTPYENSLKRKLTLAEFFQFFMMMFPLSIIGSMIGSGLAFIISSITGHSINDLLTSSLGTMSLPQMIILTVILAPIFEELLFRYAVIGYSRRYGEWNAIIISAIIFALIHTNIFQFFYTFLIGLVFGYVFVYTRRIIYSIILHMCFNFFGAAIPFMINPSLTENVTNPGVIIYTFVEYGLAAIGLVFLILFIKKGNLLKNTPGAPISGKFSKDTILNFGMISLIVVAILLTIYLAIFGA